MDYHSLILSFSLNNKLYSKRTSYPDTIVYSKHPDNPDKTIEDIIFCPPEGEKAQNVSTITRKHKVDGKARYVVTIDKAPSDKPSIYFVDQQGKYNWKKGSQTATNQLYAYNEKIYKKYKELFTIIYSKKRTTKNKAAI